MRNWGVGGGGGGGGREVLEWSHTIGGGGYRPLLSGWLILYRGGGGVGGSEAGWVGLSGFSLILGKMHIPPQGGVSAFLGGWVGC